jgi:cytochrome P450
MGRSRVQLRPLVGEGLLVSEHELHKRQRKLMMPMFMHAKIVAYATVMAGYAEEMAASWKDGEVIDLGEEMVRLTLRIVSKTLFNVDVEGEAGELSREITVALKHLNESSGRILPAPASWPTRANRRFDQAVARMDRTLYRIIEAHKQGEPQEDIVSLLLQARGDDGSPIAERQIRDELMTLFLAGHETTALALTWSWYVLTQHPDVYQAAREELQRVLDGRTPTAEDLAALPVLAAAFKESLRLYPPVYLMPRQTVAPVTLGPYHLPAATAIVVSPYVLHRDPRWFPDPERFDPARFAPDQEQRLPRFAYLPFGAGSTGCLGSHFAMMEGQLILATLAQRVTLELVDDGPVAPAPAISLRLNRPLRARVRRHSPG